MIDRIFDVKRGTERRASSGASCVELDEIEQRHLGPVVDVRLAERVGVVGCDATVIDVADRTGAARLEDNRAVRTIPLVGWYDLLPRNNPRIERSGWNAVAGRKAHQVAV